MTHTQNLNDQNQTPENVIKSNVFARLAISEVDAL